MERSEGKAPPIVVLRVRALVFREDGIRQQHQQHEITQTKKATYATKYHCKKPCMHSSRHYVPPIAPINPSRPICFVSTPSLSRTIYPPPPTHLSPTIYSALTASWIAAKSALGFAPTISWTFSSFLKIRNVGMARIPSSCATSGTSSTSSLTKCAPVNSSENLFYLLGY